ncbi:BZ3500_MvSof-1268-A1-R1_Chr6-3g08648 [Microbotryum saponariae]|uniref:Lon protease homolog, mitochondrial n=1 Tax=Microbotryum saponariae TaxID=289078 RepID=A0A2X0MGW9_9BASI|nr:BZ3500_MvSof-1268-A1-R1_Chr6-3g08648 [Microbotryum saponariae]SDA07249.1 BZ3501_MvSof-1269-A2-R1_Chr6-2g08351 [Microbotryum saponariae]
MTRTSTPSTPSTPRHLACVAGTSCSSLAAISHSSSHSSSSSSSLHLPRRPFSTSVDRLALLSSTTPRLYPGRQGGGRNGGKDGAEKLSTESENEETEADDNAESTPSSTADNNHKTSKGSSSSTSASSSSPSSEGSAGASTPPSSSSSDDGDNGEGTDSTPPSSTSLSKRTVPEVYPQLLALPITRRPLFPGFYKAVVIRNAAVIAAIKDAVARGQPYIGAFLLKDENADSDIITDSNAVHPVGVFAQITSTFVAAANDKDKNEEPGLTAVLYPHRRIRITDLLPVPQNTPPSAPEQSKATEDGEQPVPKEADAAAPVDKSARTDQTAELEKIIEASYQHGKKDDAASSKSGEDSTVISEDSTASSTDPSSRSFQTAFLHDYAVSIVNVENVEMQPWDKKSQTARAIASEIIAVFKDIASLNPLFRDQIANFSMSQSAGNVFEEPDKLADFAAAVSTGEINELQDVLESTLLEERMQKALLVLKKELMNAQLQSKISKDVENKIQKRQREYYLMEQLKGIKKELGIESDGKDKLVDKFQSKADTLNMPEAVRKVFDEEINKLSHLEPAASEFNVTRNYLDWLTQIPWGRHSQENFDLVHAVQVLDEDHYGLKDVKDRILEFLAVGKLRGTVEGKILCLVGPPGVGKTSIGKSIARALDRQFYRFSVGGLGDVAEIKGHRRTYVGAMPGKMIQALKKVQTENPLVLIDEVDKIGRGHNGDPASALLEMLDPEQNAQFLDHYLDVPVDLSRVLFVCTANTLDTIPAPLLDRMEVLEVSGYITEEKAAIASRYLAPQAKDGAGLKVADVELTEDAVAALIRYYCRESGVRRLKQQIEKVYRKAALKIVQDIGEPALPESSAEVVPPLNAAPQSTSAPASTVVSSGKDKSIFPIIEDKVQKEDGKAAEAGTESAFSTGEERTTTTGVRKPLDVPESVHVRITADNLLEYVGPPMYQKERMYTKSSPVGVSCGLGYLGNGSGAVMPIEVTTMPGSGIQLTGKLGDVIKESAQIALSFLKSRAFDLGLTTDADQDLLDKRAIHLHMPEGSIGKEGPSAGIAILTAFVSLFSKRGIRADLAMTGEMTLAGQVLPVGGLKEKILAAHRAGIKKIIAPEACRADIEHNVPESVKEGIEIVYVENVAQVIREAFEGHPIVERLEGLTELLRPKVVEEDK